MSLQKRNEAKKEKEKIAFRPFMLLSFLILLAAVSTFHIFLNK